MTESAAPAVSRRSVRIVCLDERHRILLLHWRDPVDGHQLWEPPGGGAEPSETDDEAARRELWEETGLRWGAPFDAARWVPRRFRWAGQRFEQTERFYLARMTAFPARPTAPTSTEVHAYLGHSWLQRSEFAELADPLEPPDLPRVLADLVAAAESGATG